MRIPAVLLVVLGSACLVWMPSGVEAQDEIERPPIEYSRSAPDNCVSRLQSRIEKGEISFRRQGELGFLPDLLDALNVPIESQLLVYSKTSLQRHRISPRTPRAIYFNDDVYVGFCQKGDVLEISAADPRLGTAFYTVDQHSENRVQLVRQTDNCLLCHSSSRTDGVPGHLVRSLFVDGDGQPLLAEGSYSVDHTTPLDQRWGGWYVTGTHGEQAHLGNLVVRGNRLNRPVQNADGQNVTDLKGRLNLDGYLSPHSDLIALMVFEHQALVHNRIAKANYAARQALHYDAEIQRAMGEKRDKLLDSTQHRIESAAEDLLKAVLFVDEAKLTSPIRGTSGYAEKFARLGPSDGQGRSLRELDLKHRIFKYPCSYLIYSRSFDELPREMLQVFWRRMWEVLNNTAGIAPYDQLSAADRRTIIEILRGTKRDLPSYWTEAPVQ